MCNHCGHNGLATVSRTGEFPAYVGPPPFPDPNGQVSAGDPVSSSSFVAGPRPSGPVGPTTTIANGSAQGRVWELAEVVQRTREELSAWGTEHTKAIRDLGESQLQIIELRGQVQAFQEQLDRAREQHQQDESARRDLEGEQARLNGLLSEFEPVRGRAAEADLLENTLQERDREAERLRGRAAEADLLESMLQERDSEAEQLRGRAAEADLLESMLHERDCEAEQLRTTLGELDRSLAARTSELDEARRRAREQHQQNESARRDLEGEQARLSDLLSEFEPLRGRAAEADLLESMLQERDCEAEQLRGRAAEADILESMLQERDCEVERLRSTLGELDRSLAARTSELDEARRQREELGSRIEETRHAGRAEVESLQAEIQKARAASSRSARVAEEKAGELSAVLGRLRELRADLDARNAECEQLRRDAGEFEETRVDHELLLGEIEGYRSELRARDAELERLRDQVAELDALRTDRERIDVERQEGAGESETLRARLVELEQLLAERDETCRQSERDREELAELWSLDRQELLDQAERQLGEERIRAKAELQGWQNRLSATGQQYARDLTGLRKEVEDLTGEVETLRRERSEAFEWAGAGGPAHHRTTAHLDFDEPRPSPRGREPVGIRPGSDRYSRIAEEGLRPGPEPPPHRVQSDEPADFDHPHDEPRRVFPAIFSILGSAIVVAVGVLPFLLLPTTWDTYLVSIILIVVGVMALGFFEGHYTGRNALLRALQMALVVGTIIAAVLLIGPRVLERTFPQPARSPSGK